MSKQKQNQNQNRSGKSTQDCKNTKNSQNKKPEATQG